MSVGLTEFYLMLGTIVAVAGVVKMALTRDSVARLIAMNVVGVGSLIILLALGTVSLGDDPGASTSSGSAFSAPDPVLSALVITGLVITAAFTGIGAVLIRLVESSDDDIEATSEHAEEDS